MNKEELVELLEALASEDLAEGADIYDHPCIVAVRVIDQCLADIKTFQGRLRGQVKPHNASKGMNYLCNTPYNPLAMRW